MDRKDETLKDLFRPMGTPSKAPSTALKDQFEKKEDKNKQKSKSWLNELSPMKFEEKKPETKLTPEERERLMRPRDIRKPESEDLSLIEKAKRLGKAAIDVNVGRATGNTKKMMGGYKYLEGK